MDWLQLSIYTTSEGIDPVCGRLYQIGITGTEIEDYYAKDDNVIDQDVFTDFRMPERTRDSILCGYFEKRIGEGYAMMFVNITDPSCKVKSSVPVSFKVSVSDAIVTEHTPEGSFVLSQSAEGYYQTTVANAEYSFITVEKAPVVVEPVAETAE